MKVFESKFDERFLNMDEKMAQMIQQHDKDRSSNTQKYQMVDQVIVNFDNIVKTLQYQQESIHKMQCFFESDNYNKLDSLLETFDLKELNSVVQKSKTTIPTE